MSKYLFFYITHHKNLLWELEMPDGLLGSFVGVKLADIIGDGVPELVAVANLSSNGDETILQPIIFYYKWYDDGFAENPSGYLNIGDKKNFVRCHNFDLIDLDNNNDQEIARNIFLNLDEKNFTQNIGDTCFSLTKKGWHTNTLSWTDANVINSLKGKIISKKELLENTYEVLSSIILHLIQSGVDIELKYDFIDDFVKNNPLIEEESSIDISQKEKKFLNNYVDEFIEMYDV